jgi:hypothetical protein
VSLGFSLALEPFLVPFPAAVFVVGEPPSDLLAVRLHDLLSN